MSCRLFVIRLIRMEWHHFLLLRKHIKTDQVPQMHNLFYDIW